METKTNIYDLGLFETTKVPVGDDGMHWTVTRVPGGWIMQDVYVPHLEHLSLSLRAGGASQEFNSEQRVAEQKELMYSREVIGRLYEELVEYKKLPPGKMYKAYQIAKLLSEILNPSS